jgi:hypothetical protein
VLLQQNALFIMINVAGWEARRDQTIEQWPLVLFIRCNGYCEPGKVLRR